MIFQHLNIWNFAWIEEVSIQMRNEKEPLEIDLRLLINGKFWQPLRNLRGFFSKRLKPNLKISQIWKLESLVSNILLQLPGRKINLIKT